MTKKILISILSLLTAYDTIAQTNDPKILVDSLKHLKEDTIDCNTDLYWRIIAIGKDAIPPLIDKLTDTSLTNVRWQCKKEKLNVGEIAQLALVEIAYFPAAKITQWQFDIIENGCWNFYDYFFNNKNKVHYQNLIKVWYQEQFQNYRAIEIPQKKLSACRLKYNLIKYYEWQE